MCRLRSQELHNLHNINRKKLDHKICFFLDLFHITSSKHCSIIVLQISKFHVDNLMIVYYKKLKINVNLVVKFRLTYFNNAIKILFVKLVLKQFPRKCVYSWFT